MLCCPHRRRWESETLSPARRQSILAFPRHPAKATAEAVAAFAVISVGATSGSGNLSCIAVHPFTENLEHRREHYGKYRFRYGPFFDAYICPEHQHLYWRTTTREGYRQYFCNAKTCIACPKRNECFGKSMTRRMVDRHVWQDALDDVIAFTKSGIGSRIYAWRKQTIERSFAEAKVNHGLRYARMLGIKNMREQCFLTAAVQNIKRLFASLFFALPYYKPCILF